MALVLGLLPLSLGALQFGGVDYTPPPGWNTQSAEGAIGFVPRDVTPETGMVLVMGSAEDLGGRSLEAFLRQKLDEELADGSSALNQGQPEFRQEGTHRSATTARIVQDAAGNATLRMYHAITDGRGAALATALAVSTEATDRYGEALGAFFASLRIAGAAPPAVSGAVISAVSDASMPSAPSAERVPPAAVVNGVPRGMFMGRSLLSGKTVCLLFLDGGRITRAVPPGGLEHFDWARHAAEYPGDSGRWEMQGGLMRVAWGDGGLHEGPLTVTAEGLQFHGKNYTRAVTVPAAALAGRWESARGTALWGGEGIIANQTLLVGADGSYQWEGASGGVVAGEAAYAGSTSTGRLSVSGSTLTLQAADGSRAAYTFLPLPGDPPVAFSLDSSLFTRVE